MCPCHGTSPFLSPLLLSPHLSLKLLSKCTFRLAKPAEKVGVTEPSEMAGDQALPPGGSSSPKGLTQSAQNWGFNKEKSTCNWVEGGGHTEEVVEWGYDHMKEVGWGEM